MGHIKQAKNVPLTEIGRYSGQDSKVYVICQSGMRSRQATKILNKKVMMSLISEVACLNGLVIR